jgi:hypothetical protein
MRDIKTVFYRTCTYTVNTGRNTAPTKQCKVGYGGSKKNGTKNRTETDLLEPNRNRYFLTFTARNRTGTTVPVPGNFWKRRTLV